MIQKTGYDRFASVPDKIANLYIVYALTEAGVKKEVETEYRVAVKKPWKAGTLISFHLWHWLPIT